MDPSPAYGETVEEIMKIYKSLPPRPSIEEVEAALSVINTVEEQERLLLEEISNQEGPQDILPELFSVLQQVKKNMVLFQSYEQRKEAVHLVELDRIFEVFDGLIQKASGFVSGNVRVEGQRNSTHVIEIDEVEAENAVISDENLTIRKNIGKADREFSKNADDFKGFSTKATISPSGFCEILSSLCIQVYKPFHYSWKHSIWRKRIVFMFLILIIGKDFAE